MSAALRRSFGSLSVPNYRRYFGGQLASLSGNWMQTVAELWLIVSITGSGVAVGFATALQFWGILLLGAWGGALADRLDKRRLLIGTQVAMALPALGLLALAATDAVTPALVYALIAVRGAVLAVDNPTRQSFVIEMVGPERVVNAVSLNSLIIHSARVIGPAIAGVAIALWGVEPVFALNVLSFGVMIAALARMRPAELRPAPARSERSGVGAALRYVAGTPELRVPLALMAVVGTLGLNFHVTLPLLARFTFDGDVSAYSALLVAMAAGSIVGALAIAARGRTDPGLVAGAALAFGLTALLAAAAPTLELELAALALLGAAAVTFVAAINSGLQLAAEPAMRGRVMALFSVVFLGSTPIGGPLAGWLAEATTPRATLLLAAAAGLAAAAAGHLAIRRRERTPVPATVAPAHGSPDVPTEDGRVALGDPVPVAPAHGPSDIPTKERLALERDRLLPVEGRDERR